MSGTINRDRLDAFIHACMEPITGEALVDTAHNRLVRKSRNAAWHAAYIKVRVAHARSAYVSYRTTLVRNHTGYEHDFPAFGEKQDMARRYAQAVAEMILTPVTSKYELNWKKTQAKWSAIPLDPSQIATAIAEDEAFLAAHPTTRKPRKPRVSS